MAPPSQRAGRLALQNRETYIRTLKQRLPEVGQFAASKGIFHNMSRHRLQHSPSQLALPDNWVATASRALQCALVDIVPPETFARTDYFLCSLIHPTFIAPTVPGAAAIRQQVAMPAELSAAGATSLHLLSELLAVHRCRDGQADPTAEDGTHHRPGHRRNSLSMPILSVDSLDAATLEQVPVVAGFSHWVLYSPKAFGLTTPSADNTVPPSEVLLATTTTLCGVIELTCGTASVARFLERMVQRSAGSQKP